MCHERFPDIHHRHLPDVLIPRGEPDGPPDPQRESVTWALEQDDEVDCAGAQVGHRPTVALGVGSSRAHLSLEEALTLGAQLVSIAIEGNDRNPMPDPVEAEEDPAFVPPQLALRLAHALASRAVGS